MKGLFRTKFVKQPSPNDNEGGVPMKNLFCCLCGAIAVSAMADTLVISDSPSVVRNAEIREAIR